MTVRRVGSACLLAAFLALVPAPQASACTCAALPLGNPVDLAGHRDPNLDTAFIATVTGIFTKPVQSRFVEHSSNFRTGEAWATGMQVEASLAGRARGSVIVLQRTRPTQSDRADDACAFGFVTGGRYLVEAHRNADGTFLTDGCTFTQPYGEEGGSAAAASTPVPARTTSGLLPAVILIVALGGAAALVLALTLRGRTGAKPPDSGGSAAPG